MRSRFNPHDKPIDFDMIQKALDEVTKSSGFRIKNIAISSKSWKLLLKIREIDKGFIPLTEGDIWLRAEKMGL